MAVVVAFGLWLWNNLQTNAESTNIPLGYDYLGQPADLTVPGNSFDQSQPVRDAIMVGLGNTVRVAAAGVVLATLLGTLLGIARLSTNWLLSNLARAYVEVFRNIPLLIIVVFSYSAVFLRLPRLEESQTYAGIFLPSIRGVGVAWFTTDGKGFAIAAALARRLLEEARADRGPSRLGTQGDAPLSLLTEARARAKAERSGYLPTPPSRSNRTRRPAVSWDRPVLGSPTTGGRVLGAFVPEALRY